MADEPADRYIAYIVEAKHGAWRTVFTFLHADEGRASSLAGEIADRLFDDTGVPHLYQVEPLPDATGAERSVFLAAIHPREGR